MKSSRADTQLDGLMKQLRPVLTHVAAVTFFINLLILPVSIYSLQVMDRVMATGSLATLFWLTLVMLILFAVAGVLQSLRSVMVQRVGDWLYGAMSELLLPITLMQSAISGGARGTQGLRDAGAIKQFIAGNSLTVLMDAPWSILYILVLFLIHSWLGILVTIGALLLIGLAWLNEALMRKPLKQANSLQMQNMHRLDLATRNADVIEAMGMSTTLSARWQQLQDRANLLYGQASMRSAIVQGTTKFVRLSLQVLTTAVAAWLALEGIITIGAIIAASILASRALAPFEAAIGSLKMMTESKNAYDRLQTMFAVELREEGISLPPPVGILSVENVSYAPPGSQQLILRQVNFKIEAGEIVGIIGPSGSGKSTLARTIMGIWRPNAGVIRLDGGNVYNWPRDEFGKFTGYLPQDVELFDGTVKDNIARLTQDASEEQVITAAQTAGAHDLILHLPNGYETDIGVNGALLSAGQRQRIGLARAFFGSPRLLVLDEPDSNLDDLGQDALLKALQKARQQKMTVVIISHRRHILSCTDKIVVMMSGAVQAFGPTQQIIAALNQQQITQMKGAQT